MSTPIILIGMHRSGTSMLVRLLEQAGLFIGGKISDNHEAFFFQHINEQLLESTGARWDSPDSFQSLLDDKPVRELTVKYLDNYLRSKKNIQYMGLGKKLRYGNPYQMNIPWGWKDPRNTITLPLWLDLFPDAKIVHIFRHGVDVANSLKSRVDKNLIKSKTVVEGASRRARKWRLGKGLVNSIHCRTLEGGITLWENYMSAAHQNVSALGERLIEIKYEDFLLNPRTVFTQLTSFCGLTVSENNLSSLLLGTDASRAYVYRQSPDLVDLAKRERHRLAAYGY